MSDQPIATPVLEVRDLSISFGGLRAVDHVSLAVARNRITTVIGPNGAGKSTLFNLISGALKPHSGAVMVEGADLTGAPPYRLQSAGVARSFQITNLFFELSAAENLRLAAQVLEPPRHAWLPIARSQIARTRVAELRFKETQADARLRGPHQIRAPDGVLLTGR